MTETQTHLIALEDSMAGRDIGYRVDTGCPICDGFLRSAHEATRKNISTVLLPDGHSWEKPQPPKSTPVSAGTTPGADRIVIEGYLSRVPENSDLLFPSSSPIGDGYSSHRSGHCSSCGATIEVIMDHHGCFGHVVWTR